jgi:biotin carboxylase
VGKLIHVLGGGPWQVPTVARCRDLGYRVLVTDPNPDCLASSIADAHEPVDITDAAATLAVSRRHGISGIVCDTTDWGVATAAFVADELGLPGIGVDAALNVTNKARMRRQTQAAGLPSLRFAVLTDLNDLLKTARNIGLPLVIKPVDNQSGHGVSIVDDWTALESSAKVALAASRQGHVLLEQALQGVEIIVDGFVADGVCHVLGIARKTPYTDNPTVCSRIHYCEPDELPAAAEAIHRAFTTTVAAMDVRQGVVHAEFMVHGPSITPIDVAARGGGVMIYRVVIPHVSGVDANRAVIEQSIGMRPEIRTLEKKRCACIEFFRLPAGQLDAWHGVEDARSVPGVAALMFNIAAKGTVGALADKDQRPGYVVALGENSTDALYAANQAKARLSASMNNRSDCIPVL